MGAAFFMRGRRMGSGKLQFGDVLNNGCRGGYQPPLPCNDSGFAESNTITAASAAGRLIAAPTFTKQNCLMNCNLADRERGFSESVSI